jgi:CheY-like chemotaxis protein
MKKKILIVEDDHDIVTALRDRLETLGFQTVIAYDGISALKQLEEAHPDLILLDLHLPRMSGLEVLEQLAARRLRGSPDVPVVIMSAFVEAEAAAMALQAGVRRFVAKPFEWKHFFGVLEEAVKEHAGDPASRPASDKTHPE